MHQVISKLPASDQIGDRRVIQPWMALVSSWILILANLSVNVQAVQAQSFQQTISQVQPRMVKIMGSGGFAGLEPYQSGFLISSEGHILTVWSYVLDSDVVSVTLNDGQRFEASLVGYDPRIEIAVLKIDANGLSNFNFDDAIVARPGSRVLAFSNLYGVATGNEPGSVQHGVVSAKTKLSARRGAFESMYQDDVYVLDAVTNNPGSAGGAITDRKGRLIGVIGKELRDSQTNSWLNFAIPIEQITQSVSDIRAGKKVVEFNSTARKPTEPITLDLLGIVLVPSVVNRTPPFVDRIVSGSSADAAGIASDDLIVEVNGRMTPTIKGLKEQLAFIDRDAAVQLVIQRDKEFVSLELKSGR